MYLYEFVSVYEAFHNNLHTLFPVGHKKVHKIHFLACSDFQEFKEKIRTILAGFFLTLD